MNIMKRAMNWIISIVVAILNMYLYIGDPLEKHYDLIKIEFAWLLTLFVLNYLFRHSKVEKIGYIISVALLALAYFVIPV